MEKNKYICRGTQSGFFQSNTYYEFGDMVLEEVMKIGGAQIDYALFNFGCKFNSFIGVRLRK